MKIVATDVFQWNWDAIHAVIEDEKGNPILDENGNAQRKYRYIINTGSSRSSKTWSLIQNCFIYAGQNWNKRITIMRDIMKDCRDLVENDFIDWLRDPVNRVKQYDEGLITSDQLSEYLYHESLLGTVKRNRTEHTYTTNTNSVITFTGADSDTKVHGKGQDALWINEPYKFDKEVFDQLDQRTKDFVIIDWNPKQKHWIEKLSKHERAIVIHSTFEDNPFCPLEQKIKILSYEPTPENEKNGTADPYMWTVYGLGLKAEKPNKVYKNWKDISVHEFNALPYTSFFGLDWGLVAPTVVVECKYDGDGNFYFHELVYKSENDMCGEIREKLGENYQSVLQSQESGVIPYYLNQFKIRKEEDLIVCDSNKPEKIAELRRHDYWAIKAFKPPGSATGSEFSGISFMQRANIYVTRESRNIWQEYEHYEWEIVKGVNLERPIKKDDHALDAMRYVATHLRNHLGIKL